MPLIAPIQKQVLAWTLAVVTLAGGGAGIYKYSGGNGEGVGKVLGLFKGPLASKTEDLGSGSVLAAETVNDDYRFVINVPALFNKNITAPNIIYGLTAGANITITGGQNPTISATVPDQTTDLKIFKTVKVGSTEISAGSKTDTLEFVAGSNITLSTNTSDKKITIANSYSAPDTGWEKSGTIIKLSTAGNLVSVGSATGAAKLSLDNDTSADVFTASQSGNLLAKLNYQGLFNLTATGFNAGLKLQNSTTLFSGTGAPSDSNGANGDYFFRTDGTGNTSLYTKVSGSWTPAGGASTTLQDAYDNGKNINIAAGSILIKDGSTTVTTLATTGITTNGLTNSSFGTGIVHSNSSGVLSSSSLTTTEGGTGQTTYTTGDILYASATNTLSKLAVGSAGQVLTVTGGVPVWAGGLGGTGTVGYWQRSSGGVLAPDSITDDLAIGGTSTASALFKVSGTTGNVITSGTLTLPNSNTLTGQTGNIQLSGGVSVGGGTTYYVNTSGNANFNTLNAATTTLGGTTVTSLLDSGSASVSGGLILYGVTTVSTTSKQTLYLGDSSTGNVVVANNITAANLSGTNTGDQTITLTGDVTGTGTGSFATAIGASKVTNTMLAGSIAASKLVGTDIATVGIITSGTWNGTAIANANLANSSVTVTAGTGLSGGGTVSLGGSLSLSNAGVTSLAGTADQISVSGSTGAVTLSLPQNIATTSSPTFAGLTLSSPLTYANGGTGQSSWTTGDMLYTSATNTLSKLGIGSSNQVLSVTGGVPVWTDSVALADSTWQRALGSVSPRNITDDVLVGGISTASATFRISSAGVITAGTWNGTAIANANLANSSVTVTAGTGLSGGGAVSLGGSLSLSNAGVTSVTGTANQVNVSASTGAVTFSLPQSIATNSSPTFDGLTVSAGQISNTELANSSVTVTAGTGLSGGGTVSLGSSVTLSSTLGTSVDLASEITGLLPLANLTTGSESQILTVAGGVPAWTNNSNVGNWQRNAGTVSPTNITDDVLAGGTSTASATFRVDSATGLITTASVNSASIVDASVANADLANSSVTVTAGTGMSGGGAVSLGGSVTLTNAGVTSAIGTSNQVNVSGSTGAVTFSLPQSIATNSNVTFGSASLSAGLTLSASPTIATTAKQTLTLGDSNTGNVVVTNNISAANLSGTNTGDQTITLTGDVTGSGTGSFVTAIGASKVTNTMLAGSIAASKLVGTDIATVGTITSGTWNGTAIGAIYGGTGQTTYTTGDILYSSATNTLSKLGIGSSNQVLSVVAGIPGWVNSGAVGTNYWNVSAGALFPLSTTVDLLVGGQATSSAKFQVFGGTGTATSAGNLIFSSAATIATTAKQTLTIGDANTGDIAFSQAIRTTQGGTGLTSYTTGDLPYASGTNTLGKLAVGSTNQVLIVSGGVPTWGSVPGSSCVDCILNDPGGTQTITPTVSTGTGLRVAQASGGTVDVFSVTNNGSATKYFAIDSSGNATMSGNLTFDSAVTLQTTRNQLLTIGGNISATGTLTGLIGLTVASGTVSLPNGQIDNAELAGSIAASKLIGTDIATVGTITAGTWNGTAIANANLANSSVTVTAGTGMSGGGAVSLGGSVTLTNAGVTSAIGTSNQVNVSGSTGAVTFSLPQSIATNSNVTFNNLSLGGTATVSGSLTLYGTPTIASTALQSLTLGGTTTGNIQLSPGSATPSLTVTTAERVGIGTTNPGYRLTVNGTGSNLAPLAITTSDYVTATTGSLLLFGFGAVSGNTYSMLQGYITGGASSNSNLVLQPNAGNVGIGTTSPLAKLDVNGTASVSGALSLYGTPTIGTTGMQSLTLGDSNTGNIIVTNPITVPAGSIDNTELANSSVTVTAGTGMSGGGAVSLGGSVTLTNAGVTSATGTANQVNVSASTGAVTFSLPQSIATNSNVTFNNLSLGGSATVSGGLVLYGTPTISTTGMQSLTLGDANTGNITIPNLTASRGLFTDGSSSLTTTAASAALLNSLSDETGTGVAVFATSPSLTTPSLGVASATTINKVTLTTPATGSTLTIADGKTFTSSNTLTLSGTDGSTLAIGTGGTLGTGAYATIANYQTLLTNSSGLAGALNDETGTGLAVFATSPTLTTPVLGVASATSINKVTLTTPATGSTLTILDGKTLTSNNTLTLAGTDSTTITFQGTDTYVGRATTDTLTNKTWNGVAIGATYGGTGQTTWTTGDLLYASGTNTLAKLGIGSASQVLTVSGGVPSWGAGASSSNWQRNSGAIAPLNITDDLLVGDIATASAKFAVISGSGNLTTAGTITLPNTNTLTGVSGYIQASAGLSVGGGTTYYINNLGTANLNAATINSTLAVTGATTLTGALTANSTASVSGALTLFGTSTIDSTAMKTLTLGGSTTGNISIDSGTGVVNLADLTASRAVFTDASSNLTSTALSAALLNSLSDETGTGVAVFATTPTLVTPVLGVATATSINKVTLTTPATGSTLTIADGKTFTSSNTLTLTGTDGSSLAIGTGGTLGTGAYATIANYQTILTNSAGLAAALSDETGSGLAVFATSPTLTTPDIGVATGTSLSLSSSATISGALTLYGTPTIASTAMKSLTLGDANTGNIFLSPASATPSFVVTSAGQVGIGTVSPTAKLHVVTDDAITNGLSALGIYTHSTTGTAANGIGGVLQVKLENAAGTIVDTTDFGGILTDTTAGAEKGAFIVRTGTNGALSEKVRIDNLGNVGIGTTDPTSGMLRIAVPYAKTDTSVRNVAFLGSNEAVASNPFGVNVAVTGAAAIADRYVKFETTDFNLVAGGNLVFQPSGGNVGIGTTSPLAKLDVNGTASVSGALSLYGTATITATAMKTLTLGGSTTGNIVIDSGTGVVNVADLTASRAIFTDASSNLTSTGASADLLNSLSDETGTGVAVFATTPTLVTPVLGVATATSINKVTLTAPATSATLTIADGKTLTISNTLTFSGTDGSSLAIGTGGTLGTGAYATIANYQTILTNSAGLAAALSDETGSGLAVFATSPTLTTPDIGVATGTSLSLSSSATISGALTLYGTPTIASTAMKSLTLGDANTGNIFLSPASATPSFVVTSAGQVGIGTTGPSYKLDVSGTGRFTGDLTASSNVILANNNPTYVGISTEYGMQIGNEGTGLFSAGNLHLVIDSNNNQADTTVLTIGKNSSTLASETALVTIQETGNVGIGTTSPLAKLDVNGTASVSGALSLYGTPTIQATANQTLVLGGDTTGWLNFKPLNTDTLTIKPNLLALGTATIDGTGTLSLNTTNNQAITTGTGTFTVAGAATVSSSLALGPQSAAPATCNAANEGRVYYSGTTGTKRLYLCDGTTWQPISAGTLLGGPSYVTISPEFPGGVISADGSNNTGTFTSDREATGSGSLYSFNYYEFTSGQTSLQDYDVYVRWEVPENFSSWATSNAITIDYATEDTSSANNKIDVQITKENDADTVTSSSNVSPTAGKWQSSILSSSPISFTSANLTSAITWAAGDIAVIRIRLFSKDNYFARVGAIKFDWQ